MKAEYKKMIIGLVKNVSTNLLLTAVIIFATVFILNYLFDIQIQVSSASLILGIIGVTISFAGSNFISDALGRFDAHGLPQYIWGNRMQTIGFALTIAALFIK